MFNLLWSLCVSVFSFYVHFLSLRITTFMLNFLFKKKKNPRCYFTLRVEWPCLCIFFTICICHLAMSSTFPLIMSCTASTLMTLNFLYIRAFWWWCYYSFDLYFPDIRRCWPTSHNQVHHDYLKKLFLDLLNCEKITSNLFIILVYGILEKLQSEEEQV